MPEGSFTIGTISLRDFEVPQYVRFGGRHRLAVHPIADGRRIIEKLGPDDSEIQFQGIFSGPDANARVELFDNLRISGAVVWLNWESFRRKVIVRSFIVTYHNPQWILYQIGCTVVNQRHVVSTTVSLATGLTWDLAQALTASQGAGIELSSLGAALGSQNVLVAGANSQAIAIASASNVLHQIRSLVTDQSNVLMESIPSSNDVALTGNIFASKVAAAGTLAAATVTASYIGRIRVNLLGLTV